MRKPKCKQTILNMFKELKNKRKNVQPKLAQEATENVNRHIMNKNVESVILKLEQIKSPGSDGFTGEFYQILKEKLTTIFLKFFQKNRWENNDSFYEASINWVSKPDKDIPKKENCSPKSLRNIWKHLHLNISKPNPTVY